MDSEATATAAKVFPFFDLPRELRNEIYDHLLVPRRRLHVDMDLAVTPTSFADPELLLLSRTFGKEYLDRARKKSGLIMENHGWARTSEPDGYLLVPLFEYVNSLDVHIWFVCEGDEHHNHGDGSEFHEAVPETFILYCDRITKLLARRSRPLSSFTLTAYVDESKYRGPWYGGQCRGQLQARCRMLAGVDGLTSFEVFSYSLHGALHCVRLVPRSKKLVMKYDVQHRELREVADPEREGWRVSGGFGWG